MLTARCWRRASRIKRRFNSAFPHTSDNNLVDEFSTRDPGEVAHSPENSSPELLVVKKSNQLAAIVTFQSSRNFSPQGPCSDNQSSPYATAPRVCSYLLPSNERSPPK